MAGFWMLSEGGGVGFPVAGRDGEAPETTKAGSLQTTTVAALTKAFEAKDMVFAQENGGPAGFVSGGNSRSLLEYLLRQNTRGRYLINVSRH